MMLLRNRGFISPNFPLVIEEVRLQGEDQEALERHMEGIDRLALVLPTEVERRLVVRPFVVAVLASMEVEHHQVEPQEVEPRMALAHRTALVHPLVVRLALVLPTEEAPYLLEEAPYLLLPMVEVVRKPFCLRRRRLAAREAALGDSLSKLHHHLVQVHCLLEERRHHHHPILP